MKLIVKVEKAGIMIPIERLKGINEGDILQIEIERLHMSKRTKKDLIQKLPFFLQNCVKNEWKVKEILRIAQICIIKLC